MADRRYTEQQELFLEYLPQTKGNIREAMTLAGYKETTGLKDVVRPLKDEIIAIAKELLAFSSVKAATSLDGVLDNPNALGAKNTIAAAKEILDRVGVIKEETKPSGEGVKVTFYLPEKVKISDEEYSSEE